MEKQKLILNHRDKEYLKMAMLKHEETFKQQVYELHRLYQIQKMLMRDAAKKARKNNPHYVRACNRAGARPGRPDQGGDVCRVSDTEDDDKSDLELTLGPRSYYLEKTKAAEPAFESDSGPSFSSSSTGSGLTKGITRSAAFKRDDFTGQLKLCGPEMPVSNTINQDRLNSSPWLFRALSLNIT